MGRHEDSGALSEPTFYILLSLHEPMHGYAIMQNVQAITNGRVAIGAGTLYGALTALAEKNWIRALNEHVSGRRKEYVITEQGRHAFSEEVGRLSRLIADAKAITKGN
ncbi:PadR family transcriptional regulator [Coriobacteriales bacterium OH1046]|nr:PadR family transcriptional regulator [Coriobacteriales bacterium OH1046]